MASHNSLPNPVTLNIKAPHYQIPDFSVQCDLNWSIRNLKEHLSDVYPNKPRKEDQKLIYFGRLLTDNVIIKDVLKTYEGQGNFTFHLVCKTVVSKEKKGNPEVKETRTSSATSQTTDATAYAHSTNSASSFASGQNIPFNWNQPMPNFINVADLQNFWSTAANPMMPTFNNAAVDVNQHIVMVQQAYAYYLSQYMQAMEHVGSMRYFPSQQLGALNASQMPINNVANVASQGNEPNRRNHRAGVARRNNNNNRVRNVRHVHNADDDDNRDWLDWFYILSRIMILFAVIYFYSSPARCFSVFLLTFVLFLYRRGFFAGQFNFNNNNNDNQINFNNARDDNQANNINNNNNNNNYNNENNGNGEGNISARNRTSSPVTGEESAAVGQHLVQEQPNQPSAISLVWTILRTFVLSLIPDQPNIM